MRNISFQIRQKQKILSVPVSADEAPEIKPGGSNTWFLDKYFWKKTFKKPIGFDREVLTLRIQTDLNNDL